MAGKLEAARIPQGRRETGAQPRPLEGSCSSSWPGHRVTPVWVKGHADNALNNRCDELAVAASACATQADEGYDGQPES